MGLWILNLDFFFPSEHIGQQSLTMLDRGRTGKWCSGVLCSLSDGTPWARCITCVIDTQHLRSTCIDLCAYLFPACSSFTNSFPLYRLQGGGRIAVKGMRMLEKRGRLNRMVPPNLKGMSFTLIAQGSFCFPSQPPASFCMKRNHIWPFPIDNQLSMFIPTNLLPFACVLYQQNCLPAIPIMMLPPPTTTPT